MSGSYSLTLLQKLLPFSPEAIHRTILDYWNVRVVSHYDEDCALYYDNEKKMYKVRRIHDGKIGAVKSYHVPEYNDCPSHFDYVHGIPRFPDCGPDAKHECLYDPSSCFYEMDFNYERVANAYVLHFFPKNSLDGEMGAGQILWFNPGERFDIDCHENIIYLKNFWEVSISDHLVVNYLLNVVHDVENDLILNASREYVAIVLKYDYTIWENHPQIDKSQIFDVQTIVDILSTCGGVYADINEHTVWAVNARMEQHELNRRWVTWVPITTRFIVYWEYSRQICVWADDLRYKA
jgi:hypothetical protein